jgi:hypothetical protein
MFLDYVHCLTAVRSFKYDGFLLQLFQDSVQRLANQCMVVDNENFHEKLSVIPLHGDPNKRKSYTHLRVFGEEEAVGRLAPETIHPPSLAQPAVHRQPLKVGAECRCVLQL